MPYFLEDDLKILESYIEETVVKLQETGAELRNAVTQSSETWHDNFPFENAQQQARLLEQRLQDLEHIRRNATIIAIPQTNAAVAIGHTVTARDSETGEEKTFRIGSHVTFTENTLSYASPLGALFLDKTVGQHAKGIVGTKEREFEILEIA
ncbi:MAG: hypothetical protein UT41_C0001G0244 [Candidatus Wolfebacteria bacterium GW2011_GWC2_39_22]|uniref:Transcription elongation factor GreA/GreB C-terminal domain-containing protein n=1 Tax=Candidatus Wolfebacteria bacterium GW2011_GWC2_39_22 TaxID=1619013 RepID=A0A0G0QQQ2_9BACT|nr:MAG: hypothetical protein UT41_C0001G0244 [Candidatus Wolfebacteria bacterium GW2011_GWC2_39_22]HBI25638.1 hypothetical protein [Candidatus Wolfebacteria bacterium]